MEHERIRRGEQARHRDPALDADVRSALAQRRGVELLPDGGDDLRVERREPVQQPAEGVRAVRQHRAEREGDSRPARRSLVDPRRDGALDVVERHGPDRDGGRGRRVVRVEQRRRARAEIAVAMPALRARDPRPARGTLEVR